MIYIIGLILLYLISSILICYLGEKYLNICLVIFTFIFTFMIVNLISNNFIASLVSSSFIAIIAFVLRKLLIYLFLLVTAMLISFISIAYTGITGNMYNIISIVLGIIIFIIFIKLRKYIFMVITSYMGAVGIWTALSMIKLAIDLSYDITLNSIYALFSSVLNIFNAFNVIVIGCFITGLITQVVLNQKNKNKKDLSSTNNELL